MLQPLILNGRMMIGIFSFLFWFFKNFTEILYNFHNIKITLFNNYLKVEGLDFLSIRDVGIHLRVLESSA